MKKAENRMIAQNFLLTTELLNKIREFAYENELSQAAVVRLALEQFFKKGEKKDG